MNLPEFVDTASERINRDADGDSYEEKVYGQGRNATRLAFTLVALDSVTEAKPWFSAVAPLWVRGAESSKEFALDNKKEHASALPVNKWFRALSSAVMSGDRSTWQETARDVHEQITASRIQNLDGIERAGRLGAYAALSGLGAGVDIEPHLESTRRRAAKESESRAPYAWNGLELNGPQADVIEGIDAGDASAVTGGLEGLLDFHEEYRVGNEDMHFVEREIDFHSTMYVVLARQEGLDVHVDSEYVPEAVFDDEHYPIGG